MMLLVYVVVVLSVCCCYFFFSIEYMSVRVCNTECCQNVKIKIYFIIIEVCFVKILENC